MASNLESYTFKWNGSDSGATALNIFPQSLTANITFGDKQYTFGSDTFGGSVFNPINKIITQPKAVAPYPHAMDISGNLISWMTPEYDGGVLKASQFIYGTLDEEVPTGLWRLQRMSSKSPQTDILRIPLQRFVMNNVYGESYSAYASDVVGTGKLYFSTLETTSVTQIYRFYKSFLVSTGSGTPTAGVYETQNQLFSKKVRIKQVRVYGEPWVANNEFTIALIGSDNAAITNSSQTFTVGTNVTAGDDFAWYNPAIETTYALGVRITNVGTVNNTISKIEIDYDEGGL